MSQKWSPCNVQIALGYVTSCRGARAASALCCVQFAFHGSADLLVYDRATARPATRSQSGFCFNVCKGLSEWKWSQIVHQCLSGVSSWKSLRTSGPCSSFARYRCVNVKTYLPSAQLSFSCPEMGDWRQNQTNARFMLSCFQEIGVKSDESGNVWKTHTFRSTTVPGLWIPRMVLNSC